MTKEEQEAIMYLKQCVIRKIPIPEEGISWLIIALNFIDKLQKENELMKKELDKCSKHIIPCMLETSKDYISKDKIRDFIREYLPDEEIMQSCQIYDINGILIREKLEELLEE